MKGREDREKFGRAKRLVLTVFDYTIVYSH